MAGKRNMVKIIEETDVPHEYAPTISEMETLYDGGGVGAIWDGFKYGFALGMRYQKKKGGSKR